jgi:hypothetical protein
MRMICIFSCSMADMCYYSCHSIVRDKDHDCTYPGRYLRPLFV